MPIPVSCPTCGTSLKAPDSAAGRMVKCPKCANPFAIPAAEEAFAPVTAPPMPSRQGAPPSRRDEDEYYDDDFDRRRRPQRRRDVPEGSGTGLPLGLGIASLSLGAVALLVAWIPCVGYYSWPISAIGLILGIVGLIIAFTRQGRGIAFPIAGSSTSLLALGIALYWLFFMTRAINNANDFAQQFDQEMKKAQNQVWQQQQKAIAEQQKFKQPGNNPGAGGPINPVGAITLVGGKGEITAKLLATDPHEQGEFPSGPCRVYTVNLTAGRNYQIDMIRLMEPPRGVFRAVIDPYLRLRNPQGMKVSQDDDGGGIRNARINYNCQQTGTYRIVAATLNGIPGDFTLKVEER